MVTKEIEFRMYQCEDPNSIIIGCDDIQYLNEYISKSIEIINKSDKMNISPTTNIYFMSVDETTLELYRIYNIILSITMYMILNILISILVNILGMTLSIR